MFMFLSHNKLNDIGADPECFKNLLAYFSYPARSRKLLSPGKLPAKSSYKSMALAI